MLFWKFVFEDVGAVSAVKSKYFARHSSRGGQNFNPEYGKRIRRRPKHSRCSQVIPPLRLFRRECTSLQSDRVSKSESNWNWTVFGSVAVAVVAATTPPAVQCHQDQLQQFPPSLQLPSVAKSPEEPQTTLPEGIVVITTEMKPEAAYSTKVGSVYCFL